MTQESLARIVVMGCVAMALLLGAAVAVATDMTPTAGTEPAGVDIRTPHQYVYIVYLNPADRECLPDYQERLDRVMTEVQTWYRDEMERNGFGPMTFPLERDADGRLVIHVIKGTRAYALGEEITSVEMRDNQVKGPMLKKGIDIEQDHIIIFANSVFVSGTEEEKILHSSSAYCGGGSNKSGTAWATDAELLDPLNLPKKTPRILDGGIRPYTLGGYNVTYIGGVAHEFGHALGLPHNEQTEEQLDELGYTLMGSGNYHMFGERAGQDTGAFLSKAHATILSSHPLFKRNTDDIDVDADAVCKFHEIAFAPGKSKPIPSVPEDEASEAVAAPEGGRVSEYVITGRVESAPRAYAVVAYHDLMHFHSDYDATSWVDTVDEDGRFEVHVGALKPGDYELRIRCYLVNGDKRELRYQFTLGPSLEIPVQTLKRPTLYELYAKPAIATWDRDALLAAIDKLDDFNDIHYRRAKAYYRVMTAEEAEPVELSAIADDVREVPLSTVTWASASVGWEYPARDHVPVTEQDGRKWGMPLESGELIHERGLWAHADSSYVYKLDGRWKRFTSGYGLKNRAEGSVVFVVKCDGTERFRSALIEDWVECLVDIDLTDVSTLELIVEDGGNGKTCDNSIWFSPMLSR